MTERRTASDALLLRVVRAVFNAPDLQTALADLAAALQPDFVIWSASVSSHAPEEEVIRLHGSWTLAGSPFEPGLEISTALTPLISTVLVRMHQGEVFTAAVDTGATSLLHQFMREEGIASFATIPLASTSKELIYLSLGSPNATEFEGVPSSVLSAIGATAAGRLTKLVRASLG